MKLHIDFETRSDVDLKTQGLENYAKGKHTDILCMGYAFDDEEVQIWKLGEPLPFDIICAIADNCTVYAHNAAFEIAIWHYVGHLKYGWPKLPLEHVHCTMINAYAMALPGALANVAPALGLNVVKDAAGSRVMMQLCQPKSIDIRGNPVFYEKSVYPEKFETLYKYCIQDVVVEREAEKRMIALSSAERSLWLLDQKINQRGIKIDIQSVKAAIEIVEYEKKRLNLLMSETTDNAVATYNSVKQLKDWLKIVHDIEIPEGLAKGDILDLLKKPIPTVCKKALGIRQEGSKSSTAKLTAMILRADKLDGRVRGTLQFMGASATGRWAGRGIQIQNMTRPNLKMSEIESIINTLNSNISVKLKRDKIDMFYGQPTTAISDCLRSLIIAGEGKKLLCSDFNSIEARVLAWLAGDESTLEVFRGHGKIYEAEAAKIYKVNLEDVTKEQRQIGKVSCLALGYAGGIGAFQSMAKAYNIKISDKQADAIKVAWRDAHPDTVKYWYALADAALMAVMRPGQVFEAGAKGRQVKYKVVGSFLWCQLPSKRAICYPYPKIEMIETPWGASKEAVTYMSEDATTRKWERQKTYGGFFAENCTQALSRDILAEAIRKLEANRYEVVFHVHDEIVCEVDNDFGSIEEMEKLICEIPDWAKDLPLSAVGGWSGQRYRK